MNKATADALARTTNPEIITVVADVSRVEIAKSALVGVAEHVKVMPLGPVLHHEFHVDPRAMGDTRYRSAQEWLRDVVEFAFPEHPIEECTAFPDAPYRDGSPSRWIVNVRSTETVLRFMCALFNQHAEQSPDDGTPPDEARRLEASIEAQLAERAVQGQGGIPPCPACGARSWKIDTDVTVRTATIVDPEHSEILVDRAGGDEAKLEDTDGILDEGRVTCNKCAAECDDLVAGALIVARARELAASPTADWRVITDYRQF